MSLLIAILLNVAQNCKLFVVNLVVIDRHCHCNSSFTDVNGVDLVNLVIITPSLAYF